MYRSNDLGGPTMGDSIPAGEITGDLAKAARGDGAAKGLVWSALYEELRRLAHARLRGEVAHHTLSTTELVHEAYLKLVDCESVLPSDRSHFMSVAARAMRQIQVDHARHRLRLKRGGGLARVTLEEERLKTFHPERDPEALLALDQALTRLAGARPRMGKVVELQFFGGLGSSEVAEVLGVSRRTVERDWARARAYLHRFLAEETMGPVT